MDKTKLQPGEVYVDVYMSQRLIMPETDVDTFLEGMHVILELDDNVIVDDVYVADRDEARLVYREEWNGKVTQ